MRNLRWGLLLSASAMAVVLIAVGLWVHAGVGQAATSVTRGQTIAIAFAGRRTLRLANEINQGILQEVMDELAAQGLRYLEIFGPEQMTTHLSAGKRGAIRWLPAEQLSPTVSIAFDEGGANARLQMKTVDGIVGATGERLSIDPPAPHDERHPLHDKQIIFEVESVSARRLAWRADITLGVSLLAAATLLGISAVFWRISRHAEKASRQLEHDRQLKVLGQMSAVLGHEIRNPLASLKGHIQLLLEKLSSDHPGRRGAEVVLRETVRLEELSRQVLEFARTGSVECEESDPAAMVRTAVESAGGNEIRIKVHGAPTAWCFDTRRMEEVLVNLLRNARDASPGGQPIDVTVEGQPNALRIEVRDRGEGIVPGEEERVFEPFYTRRAKGTGLGLALARRIVEGHGGEITAHNHPAGGAVFTVCLPLRTEGV